MSDRIYLVEGSYYRENSFLMSYTKEEVDWIRNGGDIPLSIIQSVSQGADVDIPYLESINSYGYSKAEVVRQRINSTADMSFLGGHRDNLNLDGYIWTEFTEVSLS